MRLTHGEKQALLTIYDVGRRYPNSGTKWSATFIGSSAASQCRRSLEAKGLVAIDRRAVNDFRYSLTEAGREAAKTMAK